MTGSTFCSCFITPMRYFTGRYLDADTASEPSSVKKILREAMHENSTQTDPACQKDCKQKLWITDLTTAKATALPFSEPRFEIAKPHPWSSIAGSVLSLQGLALVLLLCVLFLPERPRIVLCNTLLLLMPLIFVWLGRLVSVISSATSQAIARLHVDSPSNDQQAAHDVCDAHVAPQPDDVFDEDTNARSADELPMLVKTEAMPPLHSWGEPYGETFFVRDRMYMHDRKKSASQHNIFSLVAADFRAFENPQEQFHVAARQGHWLKRHAQRQQSEAADATARQPQQPFTFIINILVPSLNNIAFTVYYQPSDPSLLQRTDLPEIRLFWDWVNGDDEFRNEFSAGAKQRTNDTCVALAQWGAQANEPHLRLKLIPRVGKGPLVVRRGVGARPVLLGKKIKVHYHRGENYIEADLEVGSDPFAYYITRLVRDVMASSVCMDIAFLLEGRAETELPERVLGTMRADHLDAARFPLPTKSLAPNT